MRRLVILAVVAATWLAMCASLGADELTDPIKWSQWVDLDNGHDIPSHFELGVPGVGPFVTSAAADDWRCLDGLPVTDFHWWGSVLEGDPALPLGGFMISIHDDIPADDLHPSRPGDRLWVAEVLIQDIQQAPFGLNRTTEVYQYNYDIPEPDNYFRQEEGKIYWLSIVGFWCDRDNDVVWGWHTAQRPAPENGLDAAVVMGNYDLLTGEYDLWGSLYDEGCNIQMAFELTTIPEPASVALLGTALLFFVGLRRRRRR